jgi:hypothetical protein
MVSIEYLEEERKKLWEKVLELEKELQKRTPEAESEAKQNSKKASEFRNRSEEAKDAALRYLGEVEAAADSIKASLVYIEDLKNQITSLHATSTEKSNNIEADYTELIAKKQYIEKQIEDLDGIFENKEEISDRVNELEEIHTTTSDLSGKVSAAYKSVFDRKNQIDELSRKIFGYTEKGEAEGDEDSYVPGLKDELDDSYKEVKTQFEKITQDIEEFGNQNAGQYREFQETKDKEYNAAIERWEKNYKALNKEIEGLLPRALTAGLSSAYSEKRDTEAAEFTRLGKVFKNSIMGLIGVSMLPFIVGVVELFSNTSFRQVILDTPRVALAILPLYIPVLWMAYSANKKRNLSKRLIEEYTHKEVLSKTYEGLSRQINAIEDKTISTDLRNKLLYNILEVSSENPGKLISNYQQSDHPLMDALDKSIKLGAAVERLSRIPGFSKLAARLEKKSEAILEKQKEYASEGFDQLTSLKEGSGNGTVSDN